MFAGHLGAGLVLGRAERRVNVGAFVAAAFALDAVLWLLILLGWESVAIPTDFAARRQPVFVFPYSHGLAAALGWALVAALLALGAFARLGAARWRAAALLAAAVLSHWALDALVHRPELPLAGAGSATVGLALWNDLPLALAAEAAIVALGLVLYLPGSGLVRRRAIALGVAILAVLAFTVAGMTLAPPPPSALAMAASSLATVVGVCALVAWLARSAR